MWYLRSGFARVGMAGADRGFTVVGVVQIAHALSMMRSYDRVDANGLSRK